jgi:hypothetical protein
MFLWSIGIKGLSCVSLHTDLITLSHKRLSYARVCVEINAIKLLIKEYDLHCPNKTAHDHFC